MLYTVRYEEKSVMYYELNAESEQDALEKFEQMGRNGDIDFSEMEIINTVTSIA